MHQIRNQLIQITTILVLVTVIGKVPATGETPNNTDALHYDLTLDIDPANEWIAGCNEIRVRALSHDVTSFHFRLDDALTITQVTVSGTTANWQRLGYPAIEVTLDRPYQPGEEFTVAVHYEGHPVGDDCTGFGCRGLRFQSVPPRTEYTVATCSQPWLAYHWLPGVEDNRDKTTARFDITVPDPLTVASNGVLTTTEPAGAGRTRYVWESNYPMVDSLYVICATDYTAFTATWEHDTGTMPVEFYLWPEDDTPEHRAVLLSTLDMLDVFSALFGPYPFSDEKCGLAQYGFYNGMEHQTLTCFHGFPHDPHNMQDLMAHELAHQWWGNTVSAATWNHMWLQEGFATYGQVLWREFRPGAPPDILKSAIYAHHPFVMRGTVYLFPEDIVDWDDVYPFTVYGKGAWVLHMLRHMVGDDTFFEILREYRRRFEYSHATTADFIAAVTDLTGRDWNWFFDQWLYEEGYPDYECALRPLELNGRHYAELFVRQVQPAEYPTFQAPVEIGAWADGPRYIFWNDAREEHVLIPVEAPLADPIIDPDWWLLHWGGGCFYPFVEGPPKIIGLDPAPYSVQEPHSIDSLSVAWHKDVQVSTPDVSITDDAGTPVMFDLEYDSTNFSATLTFDSPLAPGEYAIALYDSIADTVAGLALDGELTEGLFDPLLPSGDGLPGGNATFAFSVASGIIGDMDYDGDVDTDDFFRISQCMGGPERSCSWTCSMGDGDLDGDIDLRDIANFQAAF